jgi:hypothetical protein
MSLGFHSHLSSLFHIDVQMLHSPSCSTVAEQMHIPELQDALGTLASGPWAPVGVGLIPIVYVICPTTLAFSWFDSRASHSLTIHHKATTDHSCAARPSY